MIIEFDENGFAVRDDVTTVYVIDGNREYTGSVEMVISQGTSLPPRAFMDKPPKAEKGKAILRADDGSGWVLVPDYRGNTAYAKDTSGNITVSLPGEIDENYTLLKPETEFDYWDTDKWKTDASKLKAAQQAEAINQKAYLLNSSSQEISTLQDAVDLEMATESEAARLLALKKYRVLLNRVDTSTAPDIIWPSAPN
ncbi:tail fiber assembly protein [Siccibacter colletis]|uniref:tail fiber assembly protein n=1 Tax=Siccibacter colletis TaxID=1505757 RepID=UPI002220B227|nr:tail fiber assembly protein [Siccibacter colletis]